MATHDEQIDIEVDGQSISGTFITPGTLIPGVLFVHGWGGSQAQYLARAREVAALGCISLTFDLRGHAETRRQFATVSREQNLHDLLAAYDKLVARRHVDPEAIALVGSSYGGYLAAIVTALRPVKWLALRVPALYIDTDWEVRSCNCTKTKTSSAIAKASCRRKKTARCAPAAISKATFCWSSLNSIPPSRARS